MEIFFISLTSLIVLLKSLHYLYSYNLCIGEVSLNSIDTDGSLSPHPIYSCLNVQEFNIPVLVSGGYRHHTHISTAFSSSVNGVILSSFLAKSDQSVQQIKARLINDGFRLRFY